MKRPQQIAGVREDFALAMVYLAEAWSAKLTPEKIRVYARALEDLPSEMLQEACRRAVRECRFFPSAAELRALVGPTLDDAALVAWTALCRAAEDVGGYASVDVEDAAAAHAVRAVFGGWASFCEQCGDGGGWGQRRGEFMAAYRQARRSLPLSAPPESLAGLCESRGPLAPGSYRGLISAGGSVSQVRAPLALPAAKESHVPQGRPRALESHLSDGPGSPGPAAAEEHADGPAPQGEQPPAGEVAAPPRGARGRQRRARAGGRA